MEKSKPMYENLMVDEAHEEEFLSSTEIDSSVGDREHWNLKRRSKTRACMQTCLSFRWILDTCLLLVIVGLLLLLRQESAARTLGRGTAQLGGDYAGQAPHFDQKVVKFEQDMDFIPMEPAEWFTNKTLDTWKTMMPAGTGWGPKGQTFFTTSMTHQLHCVFMMGKIFSGVVMNTTQTIPDHFLPDDWHFHFLHCVEYMRQSIMCSGDIAMEPHEPNETDDNGPLDGGWNGHHVCKDYSQVIHYLEGQISDKVRVVLPIDD